MTMVAQLLRAHPFVEGLSESHVAALEPMAQLARFEEDAFIFREHEEARQFYLIVEGHVALQLHLPSGLPISIQTVSAGHALGWSWLIPPYRWHYDARVFSPVTTIALDAQHLRERFERDADLGFRVLQRINGILAERLQATQLQLLDVYRVET